MSHPALDPAAVDRLKASATGGTPAEDGDLSPDRPDADPVEAVGASARARATARRVATPVVARVRQELDRAVGREVEELRVEIAGLREELRRVTAEHAAAIAVLEEERPR